MIRKNVIILHALEGRPIANRVVKPLTIRTCFHYKFFILIFKIQGHTCFPILLHVTFINSGLVGWTSKNLRMNMPQLKHNSIIPTSFCNFVMNNKLQHYFLNKLPIKIIQLTIAHGKTTIVNMILQMFCNYNLNGIVTKKKIDQKIILELPSSFHQY